MRIRIKFILSLLYICRVLFRILNDTKLTKMENKVLQDESTVKARVLHEPPHKVDLRIEGIAQLLPETSQRNFEVMQSIMKFS